jgi:arylsulfatase
MHAFTHLKKESEGVTGLGIYPDDMVENDGHVGQLLDLLDELGVADDTIVVYTTDNGAEVFTWPDGGATPFRGEKGTNFEGGFRVPCLMRWPGMIEPGTIFNEMCAHEDFIPTFAAAAGEPDLVEKVKAGHALGERTFKVHLDGHDLAAYLSGEKEKSPRRGFPYWNDDGELVAIRVGNIKIAFMEQHGTLTNATPVGIFQSPFTKLRIPNLYNLRSDPFERGPDSIYYADWLERRVFLLVPAQSIVGKLLESFKEFPPRAKASSFTVSDAMETIMTAGSGHRN